MYGRWSLGLRDYVDKNGFPGVMVALSGGIDSALVATIAVDALGKDRVGGDDALRYTSAMSFEDAGSWRSGWAFAFQMIPIAPAVDALQGRACGAALDWAKPLPDTMEENLQARIRGVIVMALSNRFGHMVVTTGNKSEMATGYATLYGDMCGGFALIKDVPKMLVFELARWRNTRGEVIPPTTISRPPSAELKPGPAGRGFAAALRRARSDPGALRRAGQRGRRTIMAEGFDEATVRRVARMVDRSEYKRRQGAPGVKITPKAFGRDRRYPVTSGWQAGD